MADVFADVVCPCGCNHQFRIRVRRLDAPAPTPAPLRTSTALTVLTPKTALDANHPADLPARIVVWLARRIGTRGVDVRTVYHAMHCSAENCYAALRLLVRNGQVLIFTGPPVMVYLPPAPGAIGTRPQAPAGATMQPV